jgi:hypothetical protein
MTELNIESIGADWCIDDIIKRMLDDNGLFINGMITIPENKLPHLKGTLTINNTTVDLSEAYSFNRITKDSSGSETSYGCYFSSSKLPQILIGLNSNFIPVYALIQSDSGSGSGGTVNR